MGNLKIMNVDTGYNEDKASCRADDSMSAWQVWLHPVRTACLMREYDGRMDEMKRNMKLTREDAEALRKENSELRQQLLEAQNARLRLESELLQMKSEEEYQLEMDRKLAELEAEFDKADAMKKRYEASIATLKRQLADATDELKRLSGQSSAPLDLIDPEDEDPSLPVREKIPASPQKREVAQSSREAIPPRKNPDAPRPDSRTPRRSDPGDWLLPLPDNV